MSKNNYFFALWLICNIFLTPVALEASTNSVNNLPVVKQELVRPPFLPKHNIVAKGGPKIIKVELTVTEKIISIDR